MFNFNRTTLRGARFSDVNAPAGGGQSSMMAPLLILMLLAFVAPRVAYTQVLAICKSASTRSPLLCPHSKPRSKRMSG